MTDHLNHPDTSDRHLPIGLPFGSRALPPRPPATSTSGNSGGTNTSLPSVTKTTPRRVAGPIGARQLEAVSEGLSDRDRAVLVCIAEHRYLTTNQLTGFCFQGHGSDDAAATTARRVFRRLERLGLIRRLARRVGGVRAGSGVTVWQLAPAGARIVRESAEGYRTHEPSPRFLGHCLAVADADLQLRALVTAGGVHSVGVQVEPLSWRSYLGGGGEQRWLQPDLYAEVASDDYEDRWFIEVDQGTESLTTLLKKCRQYQDYRVSGVEQQRHGIFPKVLWIMGGSRGNERAERLRSAILRTHDLTPELYEIRVPDDVPEVLGGGV